MGNLAVIAESGGHFPQADLYINQLIKAPTKPALITLPSLDNFSLSLFQSPKRRKNKEMAAGGRSVMISGASYSQRFYGRMIPKRGQVKVAILLGLAHTFASMCSPCKKCGAVQIAHKYST
ncbi:hypothetical protein SADUNF_Sadunf04G0022600 [Salix dunnii]|uniref:Uncharacterized protein n=1 Tax=Salix dunnii TaxID=1413687 RepID=A0A835K7Q1_9ROSI|nr:hypothetical protein SADUNF_Sadunf04G0022600 [Salix dunnii]